MFDKFTLQVNFGQKSGGVLTSLLNILFFITSEVNSYYETLAVLFYHTAGAPDDNFQKISVWRTI